MIKELLFKKSNAFYSNYIFSDDQNEKTISISQVNIFIGANNSGKSRFLREILKDLSSYPLIKDSSQHNRLSDIDSQHDVSIFSIKKEDILSKSLKYLEQVKSTLINNKNSEILLFSEIQTEILNEYQLNKFVNQLQKDLDTLSQREFLNFENEIRRKQGINYSRYLKYVEYATELLRGVNELLTPVRNSPRYAFTYIPPNRSLRRFNQKKIKTEPSKVDFLYPKFNPWNDIERSDTLIYKDKILLDYFIEKKHASGWDNESEYYSTVEVSNVFTGEELYDRIYQLRNSTENVRKLLTDFENFLSEHFFNKQSVSINSLKKDNVADVFVKIGDSPELPIQNLGDGIQSIIILTFPLFEKRDKNHLVFIEEPEIFLHPGFQRVFMETIIKFDKAQFFIVSHSNHILELSQEYSERVSVFTINKFFNNTQEFFDVRSISSPSIAPLNLLEVRNTSLMLANCSVWVEGISDRIYYRKYLDMYIRINPDGISSINQFKEDIHYSFVEFGGNNVAHWVFESNNDSDKIKAFKLSNKIFLIHDNDNGKENRHEWLTNQLKENYHRLQCNEVENLLSPDILTSVLNGFRKNKDVKLEFQTFQYSDYRYKNIGEFINEISPANDLKKIVGRLTGSGSAFKIRNKHEFAKQAVTELREWSDLTEEAQELARKIYNFIRISNFR